MGTVRETLYQRVARLRRSRWLLVLALALGSLLVMGLKYAQLAIGAHGAAELLVLGVTCTVAAVLLAVKRISVSRTQPGSWSAERMMSAVEVAEAEGRDVLRVPSEAARLNQGDVAALDEALAMYQLAFGSKVYPRFERLPEAIYGDRVDACVRARGGQATLCFTPAMLERFSAAQLLAVIAHLMARAESMKWTSGAADGVREADAKALLLTRDHVALLTALEQSRTGPPPLGIPGDGESWFSEDEAVLDHFDEDGAPVWRRVDRLTDLRAHLGALSLDAPQAPAQVRLARVYDVEADMLTEAARAGLRDI